ncbi:Ras-related small GTP-binding family protein, partial [Prunus dulcis]
HHVSRKDATNRSLLESKPSISHRKQVGFSIRRDSHNKNKNTGQIISRVFVCCKEGFRPKGKRDYLTKSSRAETRTGCNAKMNK